MDNVFIQWIMANPVTAVVVLVIVIALFVFLWFNKKNLLYKAALYAVAKAEDAWGSDMGKVKFAEVYTYLKKQYPLVTFFFTEKQLSDTIELALTNLKEILANKTAKAAKLSPQDIAESK